MLNVGWEEEDSSFCFKFIFFILSWNFLCFVEAQEKKERSSLEKNYQFLFSFRIIVVEWFKLKNIYKCKMVDKIMQAYWLLGFVS